ncbi:3-dehydroquinate synthase [Pedobacter flavus]|uniref:3-dehydroquinate synthase n=1 Tax=Pedobacter flavus TaxID=3113906 RepID=A0ABU7H2D3_9SPHI|nr:3-dehydroquinate synthase [Pedobacter sp. VNH31]MEE1885435.1 3-dehydroquinate synthase [Pedobacter sp. VNH31]
MEISSNGKPIYFNLGFNPLLNLIEKNNYSQVFVLVDEHTSELCLPILRDGLGDFQNYSIIETQAGEQHKTIDFCIGIWNTLLDFNADRKSLLINLGGGVVTDMGGFIAATFKRGIDFVNIPTTLLSQVDASVGGKTGIDLDENKNMIGTFSIPEAVFIESEFLETLPKREILSGFAEIIKHGLIADDVLFDQILNSNLESIHPDLIIKSVTIKNKIVEHDPKEKGLRKILNFGHTIGHAIETYSLQNDPQPLNHGEAIVVGMLCEAYISTVVNKLTPEELNIIVDFLLKIYPKYSLEENAFDQILLTLAYDKKNENHQLMFSLLNRIGDCDFNINVSNELIIESLNFYQDLK